MNNHKRKELIIYAYKNAGLMSPRVVNIKTRVVNDCKICQKFQKSVSWPKVTLPKSTDFNQVVTKDLKSMGDKYILWMIYSFTKFMLGNLIPNKRADTILEAMNSTWNYTVRYPLIGYFADN